MKRTSALLLALVFVGCARTHLDPSFGKSNQAFFSLQAVNLDKQGKAPSGLDSNEAAIIKGTYKYGLTKNHETAPTDDKILLLQKSDSHSGAPAPMGR